MARIDELEFSISLRDLPDKILVPRATLTRPDLVFERLADNRKNWILSDPLDTRPSKLRISTLSFHNGRMRYVDHGVPVQIDVVGDTFEPASLEEVRSAPGTPGNNRYITRYEFKGNYHGTAFSGHALTGEVLSLAESGAPFQFKGEIVAGSTKVEAEGEIADAANISAIDAQLHIEGQTLASLYPFLLLPLPTSPPYRLQGHLIFEGGRYTMDDLSGRIGSTDITGHATYVDKEPRPLLTADVQSRLLDIADLGPLIGMEIPGSGGGRRGAKATSHATEPDRLLPAGSFDASRLQQMDADVTLIASELRVPQALPLESLTATLHLHDSILRIAPLDFGFAGGTIASQVMLDAREPTIRSEVRVDIRGVEVGRLFPRSEAIAKGAGRVGAVLELKGSGNSISDAAAFADGRVAATIADGRVSNLRDAASSLNGGKVLRLLASGDRDIRVNCGGIEFNVERGRGTSKLFVIDTEQTQVLGGGSFDLANERFDILVAPKPKQAGMLSMRTPVRIAGSFMRPGYRFEKGPLLARAGGAIALATAAPLAALLPLIETGPGKTTDCAAVQQQLGSAVRQATAPVARK
ncbi:AsmA family protein [Variovorax robiniae]|uniref:AsmA family protein n=1 Tax=Variovorax robiniae TaxID=1836199 RepID=A0ABU8XM31_9BURK